jgi:hypothetical protein
MQPRLSSRDQTMPLLAFHPDRIVSAAYEYMLKFPEYKLTDNSVKPRGESLHLHK